MVMQSFSLLSGSAKANRKSVGNLHFLWILINIFNLAVRKGVEKGVEGKRRRGLLVNSICVVITPDGVSIKSCKSHCVLCKVLPKYANIC